MVLLGLRVCLPGDTNRDSLPASPAPLFSCDAHNTLLLPHRSMYRSLARQEDPGSVCVSVAWDWVFKGVTADGCKEEMGCALRCANDNRRANAGSLAPVESCLLQVGPAGGGERVTFFFFSSGRWAGGVYGPEPPFSATAPCALQWSEIPMLASASQCL